MVKTYTFKVKAEGLQYVSAIVGSVEGMASCYCLGRGCGMKGEAPIYFEGVVRDEMVVGSFTTLGILGNTVTGANDGLVKLILAFVKTDQSLHKVEVNITDVITNSESGGEGEEPSKEIELPLEEDIKVEKPDNPSGGGDGGIGGEVGGWGDEEEVVLPVK